MFSIPLVCVCILLLARRKAERHMPSLIVNVVIAAFMPLNLSATTLRFMFVLGSFFVFFSHCSSEVISAETQPQSALTM